MKVENNKYIIDIFPLTKIPLTRNQSFSYWYGEKIASGSLVSIPLFKRKLEGIVLRSRDDFERLGNIELKKVDKLIEIEFLTKQQLELARFISDYYISPLGIVLKSFVPKRTKSHNMEHKTWNKSSCNIVLTNKQTKAVEEIINYKLKIKNFLLYGPSGSGKTEVYIHSILKLAAYNSQLQFLILVPEQTLTPQAIERYGAYFKPEEIVTLSSNVSKSQFYLNWQRIKSGEAKIIIGTRMAVFAPFKNLGLIVIDEEQDMSYKNWDMNPHYDARTVAEKLAEMHKCPIVRGSATPSVESYYKALNKDYELLRLSALNKKVSSIRYQVSGINNDNKSMLHTSYMILNTILVDMRRERWNKNYSSISKQLRSEVEYILKHKQQAILFINRQGMSSFSVCASCKTVLKCPQCDRALILSGKGNYKCVHCSYKTGIIPHCSQCQGIAFQNIGLGTHKVEREILNYFPSARVARIDSDTIRENKNYQEKIYQEFSYGKIDILVGTQMITKGWDLPRVALVGIIDVDNMLSIPDYSTTEKAYQLITQVSGRVGRPNSSLPGTVVIQTFHPESKFLKFIVEKDIEAFYKKELEERKSLNLPPFGKIIKLIYQDQNRNRVDKIAADAYNLLKKTVKDVRITEPQDAYVSKIRGKYRKQIIIKYKEKFPEKLKKLLASLPQGWIIDVDPISII